MADRPERVVIAGAPVDAVTMDDAVRRIVEHAERRGPPEIVVTPNAHHCALLADDPRFREVYADAWLSLPDGTPLLWAARLLGTPLPEKVSGSDLFPRVCAGAGERGLRVFLLGGRPGAAEGAARRLEAENPGLRIAGTYCPPMGFERDPAEVERANAAVRAADPHVLFVGLGAPKQEFYMADHRAALGVPVSVGVGVSFEFVAGMVKRAPGWMQAAGLEWFYRVMKEPRRLWKRYATTNPRFVAMVLRQYREMRRG
ncbi:MAG TPA: WecB/TagA/CpsF family glycosyltransferase [Longimicrobium sp.]|nr:WecB/TagA/CpsF family glycosyltransferase [Longimicrobium sp.]